MAVKAAQIIHDAHGFVIDRIQTGGVSNLNIPQEKIYELGNWQTVATIRDIPDLSFDLESFDVSTEIEALMLGKDPTAVSVGQQLDLNKNIPIDIISPFKDQSGSYNIVTGLSIPYLYIESLAYRFGVGQNASQTYTLRGDSIYYINGAPKQEKFTLVNNTLTYALATTAQSYVEAGNTMHVLSACVKDPTAPKFKRLFFGSGADFTDTTSSITLNHDWFDDGYTELHVTYGTSTATTYPQNVHQDTSVKPAAVKGKDIDVYIGLNAATPTLTRWTGVQSFDVSWKVTLDKDEEFGNHHYVSQDYDVPDVSGTVTVKPTDNADLMNKIHQIANVTNSSQVVGPYSSVPLPMELRVSDPDSGALLKTIYIPDARFTVPAISDRVQQKMSVSFPFSSDGGTMYVYRGAR